MSCRNGGSLSDSRLLDSDTVARGCRDHMSSRAVWARSHIGGSINSGLAGALSSTLASCTRGTLARTVSGGHGSGPCDCGRRNCQTAYSGSRNNMSTSAPWAGCHVSGSEHGTSSGGGRARLRRAAGIRTANGTVRLCRSSSLLNGIGGVSKRGVRI
jgi:hypothetical protein